jgi:hypothetical protein
MALLPVLLLPAGLCLGDGGASWITVSSGSPAKATVEALEADPRGVTLRAVLPGLERMTVPAGAVGTESERFDLLTIPGFAHTGRIGSPRMPMITAVLDVPLGATVTVTVSEAGYSEAGLGDWGLANRIVPALEPVPKLAGSRPRFVLDRDVYRADSYYPGPLAEVIDNSPRAGLARGHRLVTVALYPVQYNPASGRIRYYRSLRARVDFKGGDPAATRAGIMEHYSPHFEEMIRRMTVNYDQGDIKAPVALPCRYDIFHGPSFAAAAQRLADWKARKGYKVRINDAGGWTAARLNDSIRLRSPRATYVVLIGDPNASGGDALPASATGSSSGDQTDLYYAECDESGYLPDLFSARISVKTSAEAGNAVDKLIKYEKGDFGAAGSAWLRRACLVAGYDGSYQWLGIATGEYCRQILAREGYTTVDTLILGSSEGKARIVSRVNNGRAWTIYTAHGGQTCWCTSPYWYASQLDGDLTNQDMYTFAAGHCCLANDYQYSSDCFGETWPKLQNKGGVSYFGSVPSTYWDEDDWLQRRYFDAVYDSVPGTPGLKMPEPGRFTQHALYWIENHTGTTRKRYYFEAYHVMNDPAMDFWTAEPRTLTVTHDPYVQKEAGSFAVLVADGAVPVQNALVCLWCKAEPSMHLSGYTDASGSITLPASPTVDDDTMWVTVSKHNYLPYLGQALVSSDAPAAPSVLRLFHCARVPDARPSLTFSATDPQDDAIQYRVLWDTLPGFPAPDSATTATYASGAQASFTFPFDLLSGRVYWWKVKGTDPSGSGKWGPYGPARCFAVETGMPSSSCSWYQARAAQFAQDERSGLVISGDTVGLATDQVTDTLLSEGFEAGSMPSGWSAVQNQSPADSYYWTVGTCSDLSTYTPPSFGTGYAYYNDDDAGSGSPATIEDLASPVIDLTGGTTSLNLTYGYGYRDYSSASESLYVQVRFASGGVWSSWTTKNIYKGSSVSGTAVVDLVAHLPADSLQSRWRYDDGNGGWGYAGAVDNVLVSGTHDVLLGSGTLTTLPAAYDDLAATYPRSNWGYIHCRKKSAADSVRIQVQYQDGGAWALIPDGHLTGNSAGFQSQAEHVTVNLTGLNTGTYDTVRVVATLLGGSSKASPDPGLLSIEAGSSNANPLAVHLASFTAEALPGKVRLAWRTESETECYQWEIGRSPQPGGEYAVIGNLEGHGTTLEPHDYEFTDAAPGSGTLYYRLAEVGLSGARTIYGPVSVAPWPTEALVYRLGRPFPNPGPGSVSVGYTLARAGHTVLSVYNILGQEVRRLVDGPQTPDRYLVSWDGRDGRGRQAANGVYVFRLSSGEYHSTAKALLLR